MAIERTTALVYGESLLNVVTRLGKREECVKQARELIEFLERNPKFNIFLEVPNISSAEKKEVIVRSLKGRIEQVLINLIFILIDQNRATALREVLEAFLELEEKDRGVYHAEVKTALPLDEEQRRLLQEALQEHTGFRFRISFKVDPRIIGGVFVRFEDTVIDGTLWGGLMKIRTQLESLSVH
ncbi:ATP synthase F1 subunit delta [Candidatus Sumerlaeota bacterium]|nr:ATP synthase F1 subunit delta [Candidatus Sumerlaeota bacterium]